jgi:hypothetical protein
MFVCLFHCNFPINFLLVTVICYVNQSGSTFNRAKISSQLSYVVIFLIGVVVIVIVWWLDLQLPMQSVPISTEVVSLNPDQARFT